VELPEMDYDDGAVTLFLYVHGKNGDVSRKLRELLNYIFQIHLGKMPAALNLPPCNPSSMISKQIPGSRRYI